MLWAAGAEVIVSVVLIIGAMNSAGKALLPM
jgi:hypothetical protein